MRCILCTHTACMHTHTAGGAFSSSNSASEGGMMGFSIYEDNDIEDDNAELNVQQLELCQHAAAANSGSGSLSSALNFSILDDDDVQVSAAHLFVHVQSFD
jgi:hypothetical protein